MDIKGFFLKFPFTGTKVTFPEMEELLKMKADLIDKTPEDTDDDEFEVAPQQLPDWEYVN